MEPRGNAGFLLVSPHLDAGQGKVRVEARRVPPAVDVQARTQQCMHTCTSTVDAEVGGGG